MNSDVPDDGDHGEPGVGEGDEPQGEFLVGGEVKLTGDCSQVQRNMSQNRN